MYLLLPFYSVLFISANGSLINLLWRTAWRDVMNPFSAWVSPFTTTWIDFNSPPLVKYSGHFQGRIVQLHSKARLIHEWKAPRWKHFFAPWMFYFQQVRFRTWTKCFSSFLKMLKKTRAKKRCNFRKDIAPCYVEIKKTKVQTEKDKNVLNHQSVKSSRVTMCHHSKWQRWFVNQHVTFLGWCFNFVGR